MEGLLNIHPNYDTVLKEALQLYEGKTLDFLHLYGLGKIEYSLNTEQTETIVRKSYKDLLFKLSDNTGLHIEMESHVSQNDMLRFCMYNTEATLKFGIPIKTVILTNKKQAASNYRGPSIIFQPVIINLGEQDGEKVLAKIKKQIKENKKINELELIFLPLYNKYKSTVELLKKTIPLISEVKENINERQKIFLLMILASNKFLTKDELEQVWEANKMGIEDITFFQILEEKAIEKGMKKGMEKGLEKGLELTAINLLKACADRNLIKEVTKLSDAKLNELENRVLQGEVS